jgi:hypothetical protein
MEATFLNYISVTVINPSDWILCTFVKVWKKREIAWEHEHEVRVFPRNFEFLQNFHKCFYKLYRNTEKL